MCERVVEMVCVVCLCSNLLDFFVFSCLSNLATVSVVGQSVVATSLSVALPYTASYHFNVDWIYESVSAFCSY